MDPDKLLEPSALCFNRGHEMLTVLTLLQGRCLLHFPPKSWNLIGAVLPVLELYSNLETLAQVAALIL